MESCAKREELNDALGQMASELSALHVFVYGGEYDNPTHGFSQFCKFHPVASLGATFCQMNLSYQLNVNNDSDSNIQVKI